MLTKDADKGGVAVRGRGGKGEKERKRKETRREGEGKGRERREEEKEGRERTEKRELLTNSVPKDVDLQKEALDILGFEPPRGGWRESRGSEGRETLLAGEAGRKKTTLF